MRIALANMPRRVVYIEDNARNVAFMADLLSEFEDVELITAPSAELGLDLVRAQRPDVVIMDIHLPGMNGFEALNQLRSWPETRAIPVIALSAAATMKDSPKLTGAGFDCYIEKPVNVERFVRTMQRLLGSRPTPQPA